MTETIFTAVLSSIIASSVIAFLAKSWIEARIRASIEYEYKRQFSLFERELDRKEKVELVAEVLAEYIKTPLSEPVSRDQRTLLNKLSFKTTLWLPTEVAIELSKRLQNQPDAKTLFDIVLMARRVLIGDDSLSPKDITYWGYDKEQSNPPDLKNETKFP